MFRYSFCWRQFRSKVEQVGKRSKQTGRQDIHPPRHVRVAVALSTNQGLLRARREFLHSLNTCLRRRRYIHLILQDSLQDKGVSTNRQSQNRPQYTMLHVIGAPKKGPYKGPLIVGNLHSTNANLASTEMFATLVHPDKLYSIHRFSSSSPKIAALMLRLGSESEFEEFLQVRTCGFVMRFGWPFKISGPT